jgi:hypothetical protein
MKNDIVIARYNEPIEWLDQIDTNKYNILLYNKGEGDVKYQFKKLPNIGRESHTYLTYMVENYGNLPDFTIFLQANPFDHLGNLEILTDKTIQEYINTYIFDDNVFGFGKYHKDCGHIEERNNVYKNIELLSDNLATCDTVFSIGAQFILPKKIILNKPKTFWEKLKNLHENTNEIVSTVMLPCVIERMWFQIFKDNEIT